MAETFWQAEARSIRNELKEIRDYVDGHDVDLYKGKGPNDPPVTLRLATAEGRLKLIEADLYNQQNGLVPQLRDFFSVLGEREKQAGKQLARYARIIAIIAVAAPILWDFFKHSFGWLK